LAVGEKECWFGIFVGWGGQYGVVAGGMETKDHLGTRRVFESEALGADGYAAIGADFDVRADAPNKGPPGAAWGRPEDGAFLLAGKFPGLEGSHAQFPMDLVGVAMEPQSVDVRVGEFDLGDCFAGEIRWQPALPELVLALDFALGLGCRGIKQANVVEFEGPAQLGERLRCFVEEEGVIIDIDLQWPAVTQKSGGKEIKVGQEEFPLIELGADEQAAAIIEHVEHGKVPGTAGEPIVERGVQLPEFADLGALPAPHRRKGLAGRGGMSQLVFQRPMPDLSPVEFEGVQAPGFGSGEAVWGGRVASQPFSEEVRDRLGPGGGMITARGLGDPGRGFLAGAGVEVGGGEGIEAAAGKAELAGGFRGRQGALPEGGQNMTDESRRLAIGELLVLFKTPPSAVRIPTPSPFVGLRYAPASSRTGCGDDTQHP
jgi:hypothetical protein